jgi:hypothetical protein
MTQGTPLFTIVEKARVALVAETSCLEGRK